ncbi:MAG: MFS transporter, partial [Thermomicrobiales bacterium]
MKRPVFAGETANVLLLTFAAFASVTNSLQISPLLTALAEEFDRSESAIGQVSSIGSLIGMAVSLGIAPWMHRWPMRTWLQAQCVVLLTSIAMMSTAQSFEALIAARVVAGIGG